LVETTLVTQKKQNDSVSAAKQFLSSNQFIYQSLFTHLSDGFAYCKLLFDKSGSDAFDYVFCDLNQSFRNITQLGNAPVVGKKASELFPWIGNRYGDWLKLCGKVVQTGQSVIIEGYCKPLNRWFSVNVYCPEKGYVAMIAKDITVRRKTEQSLRLSEKQYKKLANSIADPFFALDSCLKFTYWNKSTEKFTGIKSADVLGKHFFFVFGENKLSRRFLGIYCDVIRTKHPRAFSGKLPKGDDTFFEIEVYPTGNGISVLARI